MKNAMEIKKQIVKISKKLYERQLVNAYEGNVSVREGNMVFITPSQICKELLTPEMITVSDIKGNHIEGDYKASSEIKLHLHIYNLREDVKAVVHTHSTYATAYAIARKPIESKGYTEMIYLYDKIPLVDYGTPGTDKIAKGLSKYIHKSDIFLLANHGLVALGTTAYEAYLRAEAVESIAKTLTIAKFLGGEYPLSTQELDELYKLRKINLRKNRIE